MFIFTLKGHVFFYKANDLDLQLLYQVTHFCLMYLKKNAPFAVPPDLLSSGNPHHERTLSQQCKSLEAVRETCASHICFWSVELW